MPYIGNSHQVGDHINNFKVLDDISSYTATFDGSSSNVVSTTNETIRILEHRFIQGQRVTYNNGGGSNIGGLTSGTAYYVSFDSANTIKLATSLVNANAGTLINLSSVGGGASHTLTAAFDGTNTKFKLTHNNGESGRFNNATQLQVAINNVLQRPNQNPNSFTEGFAIESGNKIVFKTAPTSNDIFWGSIIANTLPTFDISDNKIDTFTGDGSTTEFNLSHIPANNQSLMVSIDGVLQHPSSSSTQRSYTLIANVIQFTSAPTSGVEIQVRHIGFRGATSSSVTGFYGRTGNVVLTSSDHITTGDITSRNINSSGIITATSFIGSGANLTGIDATAVKDTSGNVKIQAQASGAVYTGIHTFTTLKSTSADFSGNVSIAGTLTYEDVTNIDSVGIVTAAKDIHVGAGVSAVGVGTFGSLDIGGDIDVDGHTNLDNVSVAGVSTFTGLIDADGGIKVDDYIELFHYSGSNFIRPSNGALDIITGGSTNLAKFQPGGGVDLYFNGTKRFETENTGAIVSGILTVSQDLDVDGHTNLDNVSIAGVTTIAQDLDVDGHTNLDNVNIVGVATITGGIEIPDNSGTTNRLKFGDDEDFQLYFGGNNATIFKKDTGGSLQIRSQKVEIKNFANNKTMAVFNASTDVRLTYNGSLKLNTTNTGINVNGNVVSDGLVIDGDSDLNGDLDVDGHTNLDNVNIVGVATVTGEIKFPDYSSNSNRITFGNSDDLQIFHSSGANYIKAVNLQSLNFATNNTNRAMFESGGHFRPIVDGTYDLGINATRWRNVYADTYYGDGSNLTNVISGVDVKFEGASVGTGVTMLNFVGFNTVTPPVSGLSTITSGQNLTIGVRSGSAVEASLTGTSFNVIARSGGNILINI